MTYLIFHMFTYLALAVGLGYGAGWFMLRSRLAEREDLFQKDLSTARSHVPQLETAVRKLEEQVQEQSRLLRQREDELMAVNLRLRERNRRLIDRDEELLALKKAGAAVPSAQTTENEVPAESEPDGDSLVAELYLEIETLKDQLQEASARAHAPTPEPAVDASMNDTSGDGTIAELQSSVQRLTRNLESEQRRVAELERERELQNQSLKILHRQLEMKSGSSQTASPDTVG